MGRPSKRNISASKKASKDSNQETSGIVWSGEPRICSEQLKHYPAFRIRDPETSDTTINVLSFVYVLNSVGKDNVAYVKDLYENEYGEKRFTARWFNFPEETKLGKSEPHSQEIFITASEEGLGVECINGVVTVLTRNHHDEWLKEFSLDIPDVFFCHREDRHNSIEPFALNELDGYDAQPAIELLRLKQEASEKGEGSGSCKPAVKVYERTERPAEKGVMIESGKEAVDPKSVVPEPVSHAFFKVNDDIEVLSQDSGTRGCWFRCKVLEISSANRLKVLHHDVLYLDGPQKLEESVKCPKVANKDELGMRCPGRLTVRPWPIDDPSSAGLESGVAVDAWMYDGWWEGVMLRFTSPAKNEVLVYFPGENESKKFKLKHIRISKDWVDGKWTNIKPKPMADILSYMRSKSNPIPKPPSPQTIYLNKPADEAGPSITSSSEKRVEEMPFKKRPSTRNIEC